MDDPLSGLLKGVKCDIPPPRQNLSEEEKDQLILLIGGPSTVRSILKAQKELALNRIPFIFNKLDSRWVVDVLANDMEEALKRAEKSFSKGARLSKRR